MVEGGGGDGIIALGKMDIWVCEVRYHAKQHEKWRTKNLTKIKVNKTQSNASAKELNQKLMSSKPNEGKFLNLCPFILNIK